MLDSRAELVKSHLTWRSLLELFYYFLGIFSTTWKPDGLFACLWLRTSRLSFDMGCRGTFHSTMGANCAAAAKLEQGGSLSITRRSEDQRRKHCKSHSISMSK